MRTIKLVIEYDGTAYCGWQVQPHCPSVQARLEQAVADLTGERARVHGASRTDSGVHAMGQVAHFHTASAIPGAQFARALNAHLPRDISVRSSEDAADDFHARFHARAKLYHYLVENARTRPVLDRHRVWWVSWPLDTDALEKAAELLVGTHDFTSLADAGRAGEENVRTVHCATWSRAGRRLTFAIAGNGFLHKMVRCVVGTLLEVGRGARPPEWIAQVLAARDRTAAGPTAPPHGLHLVRVDY